MAFPVLMLFMCLIIETACMITAKLGTVYAAYSGARVASVWAASTSWDRAQQRMEQAAVASFVPFASAAKSNSGESEGDAAISRYIRSYNQFADRPASDVYIRNKYKNALSHLAVTASGPPATWDSDITVTVTYDFSFRVPGIGRMFGEERGDGQYYLPLTSSATLQNDGPQNATQRLGIGYGVLD